MAAGKKKGKEIWEGMKRNDNTEMAFHPLLSFFFASNSAVGRRPRPYAIALAICAREEEGLEQLTALEPPSYGGECCDQGHIITAYTCVYIRL